MNITKHLNLISVCMTEDEFPKQNNDCAARRFAQDGVQIPMNMKIQCKNTTLLYSHMPWPA